MSDKEKLNTSDEDEVQIVSERKGEIPRRRSRRLVGSLQRSYERKKKEQSRGKRKSPEATRKGELKKKMEESCNIEHREPRTEKKHDVDAVKIVMSLRLSC
ncbi:hypothetical protein Dimus_013197 [Dionaea muscipula]